MRTTLAAVALAALASLQTACSCGAFAGGGDRVYASGTDQLILCENGGFSATVGTTTIEGYYTDESTGPIAVVGTEGDNDTHAFDLSNNLDGTATIPQFGAQPWMKLSLDKWHLNHADIACQNLETRTWWSQPRPLGA